MCCAVTAVPSPPPPLPLAGEGSIKKSLCDFHINLRSKLAIALVLVALVGVGAWLGTRGQPASHSEIALDAVPEISPAAFWATQLPDLAGRPQVMQQWLGKVVVVNFWAPWCPPCRREIPGFIALQDQLGARGLQMVGIALDEPDKVQAYSDEAGINYPLLLGGASAVALSQASGNRLGGLPYSVVFDRKGNAVASLVGEVSQARLEALVKPLL